MTDQIGRPDTAPKRHARLRAACLAGELPAEALSTEDRARLVRQLWTAGWTDVEVATYTRMSTYTASRIRARLGLAAHPSAKGAAA